MLDRVHEVGVLRLGLKLRERAVSDDVPALTGAFEGSVEGFTFVPVLGRPAPEDKWSGATGLVTEALAAHGENLAGMESDKRLLITGYDILEVMRRVV